MARLVAGDRWDLVFNIAEGLYGFGRESLVPALLEAYQIPYTFSDPFVLALALQKAACKRVVRDLGIPTPAFAVVEEMADVARVDLPFPLFAKPLAEGTSKGISAHSRIVDRHALRAAVRRAARALPPAGAGGDLPAGPRGHGGDRRDRRARPRGGCHGGAAGGRGGGGRLLPREQGALRGARVLPARAAERAAGERCGRAGAGRVARSRVPRRRPGRRPGGRRRRASFIEVNPLAGLHPVHSDLPIMGRLAGWSFADLMAAIMESASRRLPGREG